MLYFMYENDNLIGFKYSNTKYYYIKNIQEDIIGIMNDNLEQVVSYEYDSWGNILSIKNNNNNDVSNDLTHIANINPFRYRSYYYDIETKLYYLNSRYYNPEWGRFINADSYVSTGQGFFRHNMYSYTENNYVSRTDIGGKFWFQVAGTAIGGAIGVTSKIISNIAAGENWSDGFLGAMAGGAVTGLIYTTPLGLTVAGRAISGYTSAFAESIVNQFDGDGTFSWDTVIGETATYGTTDAIINVTGGEFYKINKGWYRPKTFASSFTGKYMQKITSNMVTSSPTNIIVNTITMPTKVSSSSTNVVSKVSTVKTSTSKSYATQPYGTTSPYSYVPYRHIQLLVNLFQVHHIHFKY